MFRRKEESQFCHHWLFVEEAVFKALDAGVALLRGPYEPLVIHLLRDVLKHVAVLQAAPQAELDAVLPPDLQQGASLLVWPGHLSAHFSQEVAGWGLLVWVEEQQIYCWVLNLRDLLDSSTTTTTTTVCNHINTLKPTHVRIIAHERLHGGLCSTNVHIRVRGIVTEHRSQEVEVSVHRGPPSASGKHKSKACWEMCLLGVEKFQHLQIHCSATLFTSGCCSNACKSSSAFWSGCGTAPPSSGIQWRPSSPISRRICGCCGCRFSGCAACRLPPTPQREPPSPAPSMLRSHPLHLFQTDEDAVKTAECISFTAVWMDKKKKNKSPYLDLGLPVHLFHHTHQQKLPHVQVFVPAACRIYNLLFFHI